MPDQSHLDSRYFVNSTVYNCPFCNRRHVSYHVYDIVRFDWTDKKPCSCFFVRCESCGKQSMHLTFQSLKTTSLGNFGNGYRYSFSFDEGVDEGRILDDAFFYSVPTSFFVLDERIPRVLRDLLVEAEGCLKSNYLTGASACTRKLVYELAVLNNAVGESYDDRIEIAEGYSS